MPNKNEVINPPGNSQDQSSLRSCPSCAEQISLQAKKCKYCGEFVEPKPLKQKLSSRMMAVIGLFTACLSVFYALREGYFYIEQKQQQREEVASYIEVANQFERLDSLNYAQQALTKALSLSPSNVDLQRRLFVLRTQDMLREIEWGRPSPNHVPSIEEMILDGYRLLSSDMNNNQRTQLLVMVARLLPQDILWNDDEGITKLYAQAYALSATNPEVLFRYGQWLADAKIDIPQGLKLIGRAVELAPDDALYPYELAKLLVAQNEYAQALTLFRNSINLLPKQRELQRIRASNFSKSDLRRLLIKADEAHNIAEGEFLGLTMEERQQLLEQVLAEHQNDRIINFIAARFYFAIDELTLAETAISGAVSDSDLVDWSRGYYQNEMVLYQKILQRSGTNPDKLGKLNQALETYQQTLTYEEALELGVEGCHRYKIGLRVSRKTGEFVTPGLDVLTVYSGYPFAKAGVQAGDQILSLGHRQPDKVMSVYNILSNFKPGTSVPIMIERDGQKLEMELIVE